MVTTALQTMSTALTELKKINDKFVLHKTLPDPKELMAINPDSDSPNCGLPKTMAELQKSFKNSGSKW